MCSGVGFSCVCYGLYLNEKNACTFTWKLKETSRVCFSFDRLCTKLFVDTFFNDTVLFFCLKIQGVPLPTKPGISVIVLKLMKILQRDLNRSMFVVWEM